MLNGGWTIRRYGKLGEIYKNDSCEIGSSQASFSECSIQLKGLAWTDPPRAPFFRIHVEEITHKLGNKKLC
jgi:hypothetical protein